MRTMAKPKLLVLITTGAPVARIDHECLSNSFDVRTYRVRTAPPLTYLMNMTGLFVWLAWHLPTAHGVFFRFVDYYAVVPAFLCRLFRKPLWMVLGGYDSHWFPEYHYGVYDKPLRRAACAFALRRATKLLPVHISLYEGENSYAFDPPRGTGVRSVVKDLQTPAEELPDGFAGDFWTPGTLEEREDVVFTCASMPVVMSEQTSQIKVLLKGVLTVIETARLVPQYRFLVAGPTNESIAFVEGDLPPNVELMGRLTLDEMRDAYRRAKVYAHPSYSEGLPAAVAEAMLCGCTVVASSVNGIPDMMDDTGILVDTTDPDAWAEAIRRGMQIDISTSARERILSDYTVEGRCTRLVEILMNP